MLVKVLILLRKLALNACDVYVFVLIKQSYSSDGSYECS